MAIGTIGSLRSMPLGIRPDVLLTRSIRHKFRDHEKGSSEPEYRSKLMKNIRSDGRDHISPDGGSRDRDQGADGSDDRVYNMPTGSMALKEKDSHT